MRLIKVAAAILNQTPLDWRNNQANVVGAIREARAQGVSILCLPELCLSGYGCEDAFHAPGLRRMARKVLHEILPETGGLAVCLGLPIFLQGLFNTTCLIVDGRIVGFVAKQHLAGEGLHYEPRWFKAWPEGVRATVTLDGVEYPIGDLLFDIGGVRVGFEICEDAWVAQRPGGSHARRGADFILNPSASHFAFGKFEVRKRFVIEGSRAFGVTYVYSNLLGNEAGRAIYDGGALIASGGALVATGPRFSYEGFAVTSAVVDIDRTRTERARTGSFVPQLHGREDVVSVGLEYPVLRPERTAATPEPWETSERIKEEEFTRAISLGLFDYLRKSRSRGFVVSLSGGADSAACATLVTTMVRLACGELGLRGVLEKLSYAQDDLGGPAADTETLIARLLACVYQSTRNSSETTRAAARSVAEALGARHIEFDVDAQVEAYTTMVSKALGRELTWESDDLALQNIQARARAPGVWMLANLFGALLLSTSNRSEAGVGYATMDGDTCGGLSPIAGIDKAFLRRWLLWMQEQGADGLEPLPVLEVVTRQAPTAELRPIEADQTDEDDLMPYDVLDAIERAAIRDRKVPVEVFHILRAAFDDHTDADLAQWIERYFRLFCRNQWKRERYAPSFHVDDQNLDPKTWCRFPILSGGFERELEELRALVGNGRRLT